MRSLEIKKASGSGSMRQRGEWKIGPPTPRERMREGVYRRDRGVCAICGKQDHWAWHCHHLIPRPEGPHSIRNGATLCKECHFGLIHSGDRQPIRIAAFRKWYKKYAPPRPDFRQWLSDMLRDWRA